MKEQSERRRGNIIGRALRGSPLPCRSRRRRGALQQSAPCRGSRGNAGSAIRRRPSASTGGGGAPSGVTLSPDATRKDAGERLAPASPTAPPPTILPKKPVIAGFYGWVRRRSSPLMAARARCPMQSWALCWPTNECTPVVGQGLLFGQQGLQQGFGPVAAGVTAGVLCISRVNFAGREDSMS